MSATPRKAAIDSAPSTQLARNSATTPEMSINEMAAAITTAASAAEGR